MDKADYEFFRTNGYLVLGKVLTGHEVAGLVAGFDRDREENPQLWRYIGHDTHQTGNGNALVSWPQVDDVVRHPRILPLVRELMGGPLAILGVSIRHMDAHEGPPKNAQQWHGDVPPNEDHPLRMSYLQSMVYLTDVDANSHCFAIAPEAVDEPLEGWDAEAWAKRAETFGVRELYGPAGTVILFNASIVHAGTVKETQRHRKTIQTYYCHRERHLGSLDLTIPASLWRDHPDPAAREFYEPQVTAGSSAQHRELRAAGWICMSIPHRMKPPANGDAPGMKRRRPTSTAASWREHRPASILRASDTPTSCCAATPRRKADRP